MLLSEVKTFYVDDNVNLEVFQLSVKPSQTPLFLSFSNRQWKFFL